MKKYTNTGSKDTRSGFGAGMTELGQKNENVAWNDSNQYM